MKRSMKKVAAVLVAVVMAMSLVACGGGEDTRESVQATIDQLQQKMTEAMSSYQDVFSGASASDPTQYMDKLDTSIQMMDDAIAACDSVDAQGPDSQRYRDCCKGLFQLLKDMMSEMKNIDTSDPSSATDITSKYMSQMMEKASEASKIGQELTEKYGVVMPTTAPVSQ